MQWKTKGLIIREQTIGESDRLVTILTHDRGAVRAFARKAKELKNSKNAATQLLCYSRLNLYQGRDKYIVNDAFPQEVFFELRQELSKLALAQYFCELAAELAPEGVESSEFLRVVLNALHFLCSGKRTEMLLKCIVELRLLSIAGFMPDFSACAGCGKEEGDRMQFVIPEGEIYCTDCYAAYEEQRSAEQALIRRRPTAGLGPAAVQGVRHIIQSDFQNLFSFSCTPGALREMGAASEAYVHQVIQRRMATLAFYHGLR